MAAMAVAWILRLGPAAGLWCASASAQIQNTQDDLNSLERVLDDARSTPEAKEEAARLLVRRGPKGYEILAKVMDKDNRDSQIAAAQALALVPRPLESCIGPLAQLLGHDPDVTEAAAHALANYQENPQALGALISFVNNDLRGEANRAKAIRAMGNIVDKDAAATLMTLIQAPRENPQVVTAAAEALVEMTGREDLARDIPRLVDYWKQESSLDPRTLKIEWLEARQERLARLDYEWTRLVDSLRPLLNDARSRAGEKQRTEMLLGWMGHPEAPIRLTAVKIISDDYRVGSAIDPLVKKKLREMIGDSSTQVRLETIRALKPTNDAEAIGPLLKQLALEKDPDVKVEIARTLWPLQNAQAVDPLLQLLSSDQSLQVREAAALSLSKLGDPVLKAGMADKVADALLAALDWANTQPGTTTLRENVMEALSTLRLPKLLSVFQSYASLQNQDQNTAKIRRAAYQGLGNIQGLSPREQEDVAISLATDLEREREPGVQLSVVDAIKTIGSVNQADALYKWMQGPIEDDVRAKTWEVIVTLFQQPGTEVQKLDNWVTKLAHDDDPVRRRDVLLAQISKLTDKNDQVKLAIAKQNLGAADLDLRVDKPEEAVTNFQAALDYWKSKSPSTLDPTIEGLINQLMDARLRAHQYPEAVQFAAQTIAEHKDTADAFGKAIIREVQRLEAAKETKSAIELIKAALPLPLGGLYEAQLQGHLNDLTKP
jgi:HEAT repeat protein